MYFKKIMYKGYNIIIFCTPDITEEELLEKAIRKYQLYKTGKISRVDLIGGEVE